MKKIVLLFMLLIIVPVQAWATTFDLPDTDMHITFDEEEWYVFTPDNILNNEELEELGISYDYMVSTFEENDAYLDAALFFYDSDDYIEVFVRKAAVEDVKNLANYDDGFINELGEALADQQGASYEIYRNDYPFVKLEYQDSGLYLNEYYTIVNGDAYTITAQKPYAFSSQDEFRVQEIVDSIEFDVDESLKEPNQSDEYALFRYAIIGACSGALIVTIFA